MIVRLVIAILLLFPLLITPAHAGDSQSYSLTDNGLERSYRVYRPSSLSRATPAPLVIMLHGGFGSGSQAEKSYNWDAAADKAGFVVAYPDGIRRSWNAGGICCGHAMKDDVDDVGFLTRLIEILIQNENIDPHRVYMTGISNGAAMSYRYACEGSFPLAAIGSVAGTFSFACPQPHAISVMEIHGLEDRNIPFTGGIGSQGVTQVPWQPVEQTIDAFRAANNCAAPVAEQNGTVKTESSACANGHRVTLITIADAGHQWPGGQRKSLIQRMMGLDEPSRAMDATSVLWSFFETQQSDKQPFKQ